MPNLTYAFNDDFLTVGYLRSPNSNIYYSEDHHKYLLPLKGINPGGVQELTFMHGIPNDDPSKEMSYLSGVSDEQLLEVLIDRSEYLQSVLPCQENESALAALRSALEYKLARTAKRQISNVEGTMLAH